MTRALRFALSILLVSVATACMRRYDSVERHGVFVLTRHMVANKLDWEGGNTSLDSATLCSTVDGRCIEDADISVAEPFARTRRHHRLAVTREVDHDPNGDRTVSFHDAVTGRTLPCRGCPPGFEASLRAYVPAAGDWGHFEWGPAGAAGVAMLPEAGGRTRLLLLAFDDDGYMIVPIAVVDDARVQGSMAIAPDDSGVAWYECEARCTLMTWRVAGRGLFATDVPCPYNSYLDVGWIGDHAYARQYWGTNRREMCRTDEGHPALPRGPIPERNPWITPEPLEPSPPATVAALPVATPVDVEKPRLP